jgi:hypothetical protein
LPSAFEFVVAKSRNAILGFIATGYACRIITLEKTLRNPYVRQNAASMERVVYVEGGRGGALGSMGFHGSRASCVHWWLGVRT